MMNWTHGITDEELAELAKGNRQMNYEQLEATCAAIKARRGGAYPFDWHRKVNQTGLIDDVGRLWGKA